MDTLLSILKYECRAINEEFELASKQGEGTSQEVADFRENAVQDFIGRYYPQSNIISKGKITDLEGNQSNSIDCLVLNPAHPNLIDSKRKLRLIFSDGCDAAIEVKPDLTRSDELTRALKQGISVKKTKRSKSPIILKSRASETIIGHSLYIPFYVFCVKAFDVTKLYEQITDYYRRNETPLEHQIDGVIILNTGVLKHVKHSELNFYDALPPIEKNSGWYLEKWGEATLLGLLLNLGYSYPSFPSMAEPIMTRILTRIGKTYLEYLGIST